MKAIFCFFILAIRLLTAEHSFAQDIIVQKNGDELKVKVLEVKQDLITYKIWTNLEGPTYTKDKSGIFMIKYSNGSKDVFESNTNTSNSKIDPPSSSNYFIGTWYHKKYNGKSNKTTIVISKALDNFLVEYKVYQKVDEYFYDANGSFKEIGHLENGSIVINTMTKLSLLNENTLLMNSEEFYHTPNNSQIQNSPNGNSSTNTQTTYSTNSGNTNNEASNTKKIELLKTSHKGCFYNQIIGVDYWSTYILNADYPQPSIKKNLFYRTDGIVCWSGQFGKEEYYKNDELIVKKGDTLYLSINVGGDVIKKKSPLYSGVWIGNGEFIASIQISDISGKEYFKDSWERVVSTRNESIHVAGNFEEIIKISPDKFQFCPDSQDLYLNFFFQGKKNKKLKLEGFVIFKVKD